MNQLHVFDTYARSAKGHTIHFDVILAEQNQQQAIDVAKSWLESIGEPNAQVSQENCSFCHSTAANLDTHEEVKQQGYAIYKLEGCPD